MRLRAVAKDGSLLQLVRILMTLLVLHRDRLLVMPRVSSGSFEASRFPRAFAHKTCNKISLPSSCLQLSVPWRLTRTYPHPIFHPAL